MIRIFVTHTPSVNFIRKMSTFITIFALLLTCHIQTSLTKDAKIFGGRDCNVKDKPYFVYLEILTEQASIMCGGSLLSKTTVLTAGHCCFESEGGIVYTGYYRAKNDYDQKAIFQTPLLMHPKFNSTSLSYDFCLVKLKTPLKITKRTQVIPLAPKKVLKELMENQNEHKNFTIDLMGYGVNAKDGNGEYIVDIDKPFQCTSSLLKTQKFCLDDMDADDQNRFDDKTMFCHYNPAKKSKGSCEGDSGSPVVYGGKLIGLISWGVHMEICTEKLEVAGRIDSVLDWINSNI